MRIGTIAIFMVLIAGILFGAAGRFNLPWVWVYLGICIVSVLANGTIMLRTSPETIAERGRPKETKQWDKVISGLLVVVQYILLPLAVGLDMRYGWTRSLSLAWHLTGAVMLCTGLGLTAWAMIENAYFSTAVRIQSERGHSVCSTGPYRLVRHPGYVGFILQALSLSILLGSWWALIPGICTAALMIARTSLEDRTLQAELPGYLDYVQQVHYRLLPGLW